MRGLRVLAIVGAVLTLAPCAFATPYWSPEYIRSLGDPETTEEGPNEFLRWESRNYDYPLEYQRVVEFIVPNARMSLMVSRVYGTKYSRSRIEGADKIKVISGSEELLVQCFTV